MIITRLNGGLGNQLFQYAFGRSLAARHGVPLRLDIRDYRNSPKHGLLITNFAITSPFLSSEELAQVPDITRRSRWQRLIWNLNPTRLRWIRERPYGYQPHWLTLGKALYLDGYWQSEMFFSDFVRIIRKELTLTAPLSSATQEVAARMQRTRSVALHVRRGDYITDPRVARLYLPLPLSYYERCLGLWNAHSEETAVFIFSNDIDWCKNNIRWPYPTFFVDHTDASTAHEDLYLMQQAKCCITANSTLSWWGAWLGSRPNQIVYTPDNWFYPNTLADQYIPCQHWIRVPTA